MRHYGFYSENAGIIARLTTITKRNYSSVLTLSFWIFTSLVLGIIIGLAAVMLPPLASFGLVAVIGLVLIWAMPELHYVPLFYTRVAFRFMLMVELSVPAYYALSISGLPWISARRLSVAIFLLFFAVMIGGSRAARHSITEVVKANKLLTTCAVGYIVMASISVFSSVNQATSLSNVIDGLLTWYMPFFAVMIFAREFIKMISLIRLICYCSFVVSLGGVISVILHTNFYLMVLPSWVIDAMVANTPGFERLLHPNQIDRHGLYRAESIFSVSLSFGEFEAMILCFGYYFALNASAWRGRAFGVVTILSSCIGVIASGSRGGYMSAIVGTIAFTIVEVLKMFRSGGRSLIPALASLVAGMGFVILLTAVFTVPAVHNRVLGGGADRYSDQARIEQWQLGWPKIQSNPVTGHGFGMGGAVVGYHADTARPSIDSYILSILVETGVPGLLFFVGAIAAALATSAKIAIMNKNPQAALGSALAGCVAAFAFYRIGLSQIENFTLYFILLALIACLNAQSWALSPASGPGGSR